MQTDKERLRILIVEDEPIIAENIGMYLNNYNYTISGMAYDADEAFQELKSNTPDLVLLDINLGSTVDGVALAEYINKNYNLPFVFLTAYSDTTTLHRAKATNPMGYIVKPFHEAALYATVEIAWSNHVLRLQQHVPALSPETLNLYTQTSPMLSTITEREFEVLQLIYDGKTNQQITEQLYISINTLKRHINNAYDKLDVRTRTEAISKLRRIMMG